MTAPFLLRGFAVCCTVGLAVGLPAALAVVLRRALRRRYAAAGIGTLWAGLALLLTLLPAAVLAAPYAGNAWRSVQSVVQTAAPAPDPAKELWKEQQTLPGSSAAAPDAAPQTAVETPAALSPGQDASRPDSGEALPAAPAPSQAASGAADFAQSGAPDGGSLSPAGQQPPQPSAAEKADAAASGFALLPAAWRPAVPDAALPGLFAAALVWCAGMVLCAAFTLGRYLYWRGQCRRWACPVREADRAIYRELCTLLGVRRAPTLVCSRWVRTPMLTGVVRPVLLLPAAAWRPQHLRYIFAHELIHLQRRDLLRGLLHTVAGILHWYHPAVWLLADAARRDAEQATDAAVLALFQKKDASEGGSCSAAYGEALLHSVVQGRTAPGAAGFSASKKELKERMKHLFDVRPGRQGRALTCLLLCGCLTVALFAGCTAAALEITPAAQTSGSTSEAPPAAQTSVPASENTPAVQTSASVPEDASAVQQATGGLLWPVPQYNMVSARFEGPDRHNGIDLEAARGKNIVAAADGVVSTARYTQDGYGNYLILDHGRGVTTVYAHCLDLLVREGDTVVAGQSIATVGNTGAAVSNHCHFEYRVNNVQRDPAPLFRDRLLTEYTSLPWGLPVTLVRRIVQSYSEQTPWVDIVPGAWWYDNTTNGRPRIDAPAGGVVIRAVEGCIELDHGGGVTSRYTGIGVEPLSRYIAEGQIVSRGFPVAAAQDVVRFEVFRNGEPIDPATYVMDGMAAVLTMEGEQFWPDPDEAAPGWMWPVPGYAHTARLFGEAHEHSGVDIAASFDTPIYAAADGVVAAAEVSTVGYGIHVILDHGTEDGGKVTSLYAHCSSLEVEPGDHVKKGDLIARVGSTGNSTGSHCHFEVRVDDVPVDPLHYVGGAPPTQPEE